MSDSPLHTDVFDTITIFPSIAGGTIVQWSLRPGTYIEGPLDFYLQVSETRAGDFEDVNAGPVTDTYLDVDAAKRLFNKSISELSYRVKLAAPGGQTYYSEPKTPYANWNRHDWLISRSILRKEELLASKYTGEKFWLFKRKIWGSQCPDCLEWNTKESTNPNCTTCYGTAIIGGYFDPYELWVTPTVESRKKQLDAQRGQIQPMTKFGRCIAFPEPARDDVLMSDVSDRRYYVHNVQHIAEMRSLPLVCRIEMRQAPFGDPVYNIPFYLSSSPS